MKKHIKKQIKKAYKRFRASKYFAAFVAIAAIVFIIYVLLPFPNDNKRAVEQNIKNLEIPYSPYDEQVVEHKGYTLGYNEENEQPNWVAYSLTKANLSNPVTERDGDFKEDPKVITKSATKADYVKSNYDRGHLAPAADFKWDSTAMNESFYMSNMSPQKPDFNRGIWSSLEGVVRNNAYNNEILYITTGPVFYEDVTKKTIGQNKVRVPDAFYKALLVYKNKDKKAIGFLLPNEKGNKPLSSYTLSIDNLEKITGLDFFYKLDDEEEDKIERTYNLGDWEFSEFRSPEINSEKPFAKQSTSDHSAIRTLTMLKEIKKYIRQKIGLN